MYKMSATDAPPLSDRVGLAAGNKHGDSKVRFTVLRYTFNENLPLVTRPGVVTEYGAKAHEATTQHLCQSWGYR